MHITVTQQRNQIVVPFGNAFEFIISDSLFNRSIQL